MGRKAYKWVLRDWSNLQDLENAATLLETMRFSRQIEPQLLDGPSGRRLLVIAPHPDDEAIGPGGTLIRAQRAGAELHVLYVSPGLPEELPARREEADKVCARLGASGRFLAQEIFAYSVEETAAGLRAAVAEIRPDAIFVPFVLDDNDDHRRVNEALAAAFEAVTDGAEIWAYQVYTPLPGNVAVEITDLAEEKAELIRLYETQMQRRDWAHFALGLNAFNCRLVHGMPGARYFETFFVTPMADYIAFCRGYFRSGDAYYEQGYRPARDG